MPKNKHIVILLITLEFLSLLLISFYVGQAKFSSNNVFAETDDLTVVVRREQYYFKNDSMWTKGYLYWSDLKDGVLELYGNTSNMYLYEFWDAIGPYQEGVDFQIEHDRIVIHVRTTELYYQIRAYYQPDYFQDTNFIVIFDTFWAQFSYLTPEGEEIYAPVNYYNKQVLPEGAGLVSYAPTDGALVIKEGNSFGIEWQYQQRQMDPFHDPLTYEITYNFDPIYLQFTQQMYELQQQQQQLEQEKSLLNLMETYFKLIAFLAVVLSIIAALIGYLRSKTKFKSQLEKAKSMPKKMMKDVEAEKEPGKGVASLFNILFVLLLISSPVWQVVGPNYHTTPDINPTTYGTKIGIANYYPIPSATNNIIYDAIIDLGKDGISSETVSITLPYTVQNFSIWVDTSTVLDFKAYNQLGAPVSFQDLGDHYLIHNVQGYLKYEIIRPYVYYNNSNILVYLDYFWLYFINPDEEPPDNYLNADITYTVIIPEGAILYSASPEDYLTLSKTPEGRRKVIFTMYDRAIDPYHDPFSMQVTYSFVDVIEAIENQSARFEHFRVRTELTKEEKASLLRNLIFISLLGLIAPLLAFLLTYYIMRNRLMKKIKEEEQKYEMLIPIEESQIEALKKAAKIDSNREPWKAMLGGYWELLAFLSRFTPVNLLALNEDQHEKIIRKYIPSFLIDETLELLSVGRSISKKVDNVEALLYTRHQAREYLESVMKLMEKLENWRREKS